MTRDKLIDELSAVCLTLQVADDASREGRATHGAILQAHNRILKVIQKLEEDAKPIYPLPR